MADCVVVASRAGVSDATACYIYAAKLHQRREQLVGQAGQLDAQDPLYSRREC